MEWWQAIILGFVQGATEFLPVSSSGHLILIRHWMGLSGDFLLFDSLLHLATLFAIVIVLRKDILKLWKPPFKVFGMIILASVPAIITGYFLQSYFDDYFSGPRFLWIFFFLTAALLLLTEWLSKRNAKTPAGEAPVPAKPLWEVEWKVGMTMGLMQSVAIIPGLSRSGTTIFGGVLAKGNRESVAKFSFLLSIPVICGAVLLQLYQLVKAPQAVSQVESAVPLTGYIFGTVIAFMVGFLAIKFMLRVIAKANFKWFALYLGILGTVTLIVHFILGI